MTVGAWLQSQLIDLVTLLDFTFAVFFLLLFTNAINTDIVIIIIDIIILVVLITLLTVI